MAIDKILVLFSGFGLLVFVYWFFLMKKEKPIVANGAVDVIVEGGYSPSVISVPRGKIMRINFLRKDNNSCLEEVVLGGFRIRRFLPLNEKVSIELNPKQKGEYQFSCGMGMYHGKIIVT